MSPAKKIRNFPPITECRDGEYESIAADLDGTLLLSRSSFPYFMLVAVEAGSLFRGLILLLSLPMVIVSYLFVSESLGIQILIFISFAGLKIRDIELVSRAVLPRYGLHIHRSNIDFESIFIILPIKFETLLFVVEFVGGFG